MFLFLFLCHMLSLSRHVEASSADFIFEEISSKSSNLTALKHDIAPAWVSSPQVRGTSDILYSCLITLLACVYTAVHLNVPPIHETKRQFLWRKTKWVTLALFAPEIVLYTAYAQHSEARRLVKELNRIRCGNENGASAGDLEGGKSNVHATDTSASVLGADENATKYDIRSGFFIVMGGCITTDVGKISDKYTYATITPKGAIALAREGLFIDIPPEKIADKSKANLFGKSLVCLQATWFVIQCIARAIASYPVVLLEVHTMVHVVCALVMYILWWNKPQDVSDPEKIDTSDHMGFLALRYMFSDLSGHEHSDMRIATNMPEESQRLSAERRAELLSWIGRGDSNLDLKIVDSWQVPDRKPEEPDEEALVLVCGSLLGCQRWTMADLPKNEGETGISLKDIQRWHYAAQALQGQECHREHLQALYEDGGWRGDKNWAPLRFHDLKNRFFNQLLQCVPDLPRGLHHLVSIGILPGHIPHLKEIWDFVFDEDYVVGVVLLMSLPTLYGGIHLAAWHFQFASGIEKLLWKVAAFIIMAGFFGPVVISGVAHYSIFSLLLRRKLVGALTFLSLTLSFVLLVILYSLSRVYLVVESFISLRHVPIGAYAAIPWVQCIPHV